MKEKITHAARRILCELSESNVTNSSVVAKKLDITYSHVSKTMYFFKKNNLLTVQKVGRTKQIVLTPSGQTVAKVCKELSEFEDQLK